MRFLNMGSLNIDFVYKMDHIVTPGETLAAESLERFPGGKGLNQSVAAAKAGAEIYHAGIVGTNGDFLVDELKKVGVNTEYIKKAEAENGHAIIQVNENGENCIFLYHGTNHRFTEDYIDDVLSNFSSGDVLILQNEINNIEYIIVEAAKRGMKIVLNPSPIDKEIKKLSFEKISLLILNEIEAAAFYDIGDYCDILKRFNNDYPDMAIMLTLGSKGCLHAYKGKTDFCPAFSVKAVDTTAAGDTFTGYFVVEFLQSGDAAKAAKIASAAAAIAVSRKGASCSIPNKDEVERFLNIQ